MFTSTWEKPISNLTIPKLIVNRINEKANPFDTIQREREKKKLEIVTKQ